MTAHIRGDAMIDQLLGIGGLSILTFLVVRITMILRAAWQLEQAGELEPILRDQ